MKKLFFITLLLLCFHMKTNAQEWFTSLKSAKEKAISENKNIVIVFQGSDWCTPCIKLEREIWSKDSFKKLAEKHFVMVRADFPKKKANKIDKIQQEQNNKLAEKFNKKGFFPYVVVINPNEKILGNMGYEKVSPELYFKKLSSFEN